MNQSQAEQKAKDLQKFVGNSFKKNGTINIHIIEKIEALQISGTSTYRVWITFKNPDLYDAPDNGRAHDNSDWFFENHTAL